MTDRHPLFHGRHQMASRVGNSAFPRGARGGSAPGAGHSGGNVPQASTSVRRNLFQSQLTRRPTPAASTASSVASSNDGLRGVGGGGGNGALLGNGSDSGLGDSESDANSRGPLEIVVRDRNGEVELMDPPSPTADELSEMALDTRQENERERQRLADTIKYHQQRTSIPGQPEGEIPSLAGYYMIFLLFC